MQVLASFSAFHVHYTSPQEPSTQHLCLSNPRCSSPTGLLRSVHRNNTRLHRPLNASLWFVTDLSSRFLSVDCVVGGEIVPSFGNSGTFTYTVPPTMQMYWIMESMLISACLSGVPSTEHSGTPVFLHGDHEVGDVIDPTSLILIASPVLCSPTIKGSTVVVVRGLEVR